MSLRASAGPNYASRCLCNLCARNSANTKLKQVAARSFCELNLNAAKYNYLFVVRLWILAVARCDFESVVCRTSWRNGCCVALHCCAALRCVAAATVLASTSRLCAVGVCSSLKLSGSPRLTSACGAQVSQRVVAVASVVLAHLSGTGIRIRLADAHTRTHTD